MTLRPSKDRSVFALPLLMVAALGASATANANTCVWTGASGSAWSSVANWSGCGGSAPSNGDTLQFPEGAANKISTHDIATLTTIDGLAFTGTTSGYALSGNALSLGGSGITNDNSAGTNTLAMDLMLSAPQSFAGNFGAMMLDGGLDLAGQDLTITWSTSGGAASPWNLNGVIAGSGNITVIGIGNNGVGLNLSGTNTFAGMVTLVSGYTRMTNGAALGLADGSVANGTSIGAGATLQLNSVNVGNESLTLAPGSGQFGNGMLQPKGSNDWAGPVTLPGIGQTSLSGHFANDLLSFSGVVSGSGGFNLGTNSAFRYRFSNPGNSFSGGISTVNNFGAVIELGNDDVIPDSSAVTLVGTSTLDMNSKDDSIAGLSCTATDKVIIPMGSALTIGSGNASTTCAGVISGQFSNIPFTVLTKTGSGTLTLSGDNTYPGEVDVLGGGLEVTGSLPTDPASAIFVSSGQNASLFGTGTIGKVVTAGNIHGGTSSTPGTLTMDFLSFNGVGNLSARIASAASYDRINATNVNMSTNPALAVTLGYVPTTGSSFTLIENMGGAIVQGTFNGLPEGATLPINGIPFVVSYVGGDGNDVTLTAGSSGAPPSVTYLPAVGNQVNLSALGAGSISAVATDFLAGTTVTISNCAVTPSSPAFPPSAFSVLNPTFASPNGSIGIACTSQAASVSGTLSCNELSNGAAGPTVRSWPITCPAIVAGTPPTVALGSSSVGLINGVGSIDVDVLTSGTAIASLALDCSIPIGSAHFQIISGSQRHLDAPAVLGENAPAIGLSCVEQTTTQTSLLTCTQIASPGANPSPLTATVTCRGNSTPPPPPPLEPAAPLPTLSLSALALLIFMILAIGVCVIRLPQSGPARR